LLDNFKEIIARLEQQKGAIDKAIAALREFDQGDSAAVESPKTAMSTKAVKKVAKKRVMSEEGRQRIIAASKKRWAAVRKAAKKAA
jgi:hypothetical protein